MDYLYTVWFRNTSLPSDDQDYEWPACIMIDADGIEVATAWGDHLTKRFTASRPNEQFLHSVSEPILNYTNADISSTPRIKCGYEASDSELGW